MWVYTQKEIYFKELVYVVMEAGKPKSSRGLAGWRPGKADAAVAVRRQATGELPLAQGGWSFCSV